MKLWKAILKASLSTIIVFGLACVMAWIATQGVWGVFTVLAIVFVLVVIGATSLFYKE